MFHIYVYGLIVVFSLFMFYIRCYVLLSFYYVLGLIVILFYVLDVLLRPPRAPPWAPSRFLGLRGLVPTAATNAERASKKLRLELLTPQLSFHLLLGVDGHTRCNYRFALLRECMLLQHHDPIKGRSRRVGTRSLLAYRQ